VLLISYLISFFWKRFKVFIFVFFLLHLLIIISLSLCLQRLFPAIATCVRNISSDSTDLKGVMADKIPKEQERVKNFRKSHGATKVGEVTVEMVSTRAINRAIITDLDD
jgi:hypothetical protein